MASLDHSFTELQPGYLSLWREMKVSDLGLRLAEAQLKTLRDYRIHYAEAEKLTRVPWYWIGITHLREAGPNFHAWLHNGDPMFDHHGRSMQTTHVPAGRPPNPRVSWEEGAADALLECQLAHNVWDWTPERCAWAWERYNGFGYRDWHHIPSPYLWGHTSVQEPGKYVRDREFDPSVMDEQLGTMAVLKLVLEEEQKA